MSPEPSSTDRIAELRAQILVRTDELKRLNSEYYAAIREAKLGIKRVPMFAA